MMQLTGQNWSTKSLSGGYKMTNGSRVRKLFFKNGRNNQTVLRGHHIYKEVWRPVTGQELQCSLSQTTTITDLETHSRDTSNCTQTIYNNPDLADTCQPVLQDCLPE